MRFFRSRKPTTPADEPAANPDGADALDAGGDADEEIDDDADLAPPGDDSFDADDEAREWRERAETVIPGGASTGSKRAAALLGSDDADDSGVVPPVHYVRASGCELV